MPIFTAIVESSPEHVESAAPNFKGKVESTLLRKIAELETIKAELEADIRSSTGSELESTGNLLIAVVSLIEKLRITHQNIARMGDAPATDSPI